MSGLIVRLVFLLFWTVFAAQASAQQGAVVLTRDDAIALALEESYEARRLQLRLKRAEQNMIAAKGRFKTKANLTLNAPDFNEQVRPVFVPNELPNYNTTGSLRWQSGLQISQPLPTNGSISLNSDLFQTRESVFIDQLDETQRTKRFFTSFGIRFRQPLFEPNTLKLGMEKANLELEREQRQFTRTQLNLIYDVTFAFYDLYRATRGLEIAWEEAKQQKESYELARKKFQAGLIAEVEALRTEVDLAQSRNELLDAEGTLSTKADQFKMKVGLPLEEEVTVETDFALNLFEVDEAKAIEHGLSHRAEIREREINRRLAEITLRETDAQTAIKAEISASYELSGISDPSLSFDTSIADLFESSLDDLRRRPRNRGVQFNVTVPLWDSGVNRAEVATARATLKQSQLNVQENQRRVKQQIRSAITQLRSSRNRLDVLEKNEEVAQRSYEISLARFDNGDITSQDLASDRDRLTQARSAYLGAYIQYQLAVADLKRQTLYDFERDRSLVERVR